MELAFSDKRLLGFFDKDFSRCMGFLKQVRPGTLEDPTKVKEYQDLGDRLRERLQPIQQQDHPEVQQRRQQIAQYDAMLAAATGGDGAGATPAAPAAPTASTRCTPAAAADAPPPPEPKAEPKPTGPKEFSSADRLRLQQKSKQFANVERDLEQIKAAEIDEAKLKHFREQGETFRKFLETLGGPDHPELAAEDKRAQAFLECAEARAKEGADDRTAGAKEANDRADAQVKGEAFLLGLIGEVGGRNAVPEITPAVTDPKQLVFEGGKDKPTEDEVRAWAQALRKLTEKQKAGAAELAKYEAALSHNVYWNKSAKVGDWENSLYGFRNWFVKDLPNKIASTIKVCRRVDRGGDWNERFRRAVELKAEMPRADRVPDNDVARMIATCREGIRFRRLEATFDKEYAGKDTAEHEKDVAALEAKIKEVEGNREALLKRVKFSDMVSRPLDEPELLALAKKIIEDPKYGTKRWESDLAPDVPRTVEIARMVVICEKLTETKVEWRSDAAYPIDLDYFKVSTAEKCSDGNHWIRTYAFWYCRLHFSDYPKNVWFLVERDDDWSRILPENIEK